jgi:hypothetical protein
MLDAAREGEAPSEPVNSEQWRRQLPAYLATGRKVLASHPRDA